MSTKCVKDLQRGDRVKVNDPDGTARVTAITRSRIFEAAPGTGGAYEIDLMIESGPNAGKKIEHQLHTGNDTVALV